MKSDRAILGRFNEQFKKIDLELINAFSSEVSRMEDIGRHSLLGQGKRLRPLLFVLSCRLCGNIGDDIYRLSTIFEYIHSASLLHDDVIDNAETRRNKPSASNLWGNSAAVLTGDYLSAIAASISLESNNLDFIKMAVDTGVLMTQGQFLELTHTGEWEVQREEYMKIIINKTAELMSAACACGAIISGADKKVVNDMKNYGLNLGIAFQIIDDLLDYTSSEKEFGKPVGKDLREGKATLPLIYAIFEMGGKEKEILKTVFEKGDASEDDYESIIEYVRNCGVTDRIRSEAQEYIDRSAGFLNDFPESSMKEDLLVISRYFSERNY